MPFAASEDSEPQPDFAVVAERTGLEQTPRQAFLIIEVSDSTLKYDTGIKAPAWRLSDPMLSCD